MTSTAPEPWPGGFGLESLGGPPASPWPSCSSLNRHRRRERAVGELPKRPPSSLRPESASEGVFERLQRRARGDVEIDVTEPGITGSQVDRTPSERRISRVISKGRRERLPFGVDHLR